VDVLKRLEAQQARMAAYLAAVQRGEFSNEWVDEVLRQQECEISDRADRKPCSTP